MSKNIIIQEAGLPQSLTVDALRLKKQGSGSEDWLPADGKNLVELDIGGSGTYKASDYNAYGIAVARVTPKYGGGATSKAAQQPGFGNLHIPVIQEGGLPVMLSARMVKTNLQGGGTCLWVPEDEVNLDTKYVDHSGTYRASADNCYGYSQITVSGVDVEVTQDEDGDDVAEITDGGETREEKLPSSIIVVTPPTNQYGVYMDGQEITKDGMVVKAYTESGIEWGIVPNAEITLAPDHADFSQTSGNRQCEYSGFGGGPWPNPINSVFGLLTADTWIPNDFRREITNGYIAILRYPDSPTNINVLFCSASPDAQKRETNQGDGYWSNWSPLDYNYTHDGKTVYYSSIITGYGSITNISGGENQAVSGNELDAGKAAWVIVYGTIINKGNEQHIGVSWPRPYDQRMLETTFDIYVAPPIYGDSDN